MALFDKTFLTILRKFGHQILNGDNELNKKSCAIVSQVGIQYQNSPIINYNNQHSSSIAPGKRAPNVIIDPSTRLYDYLRNTHHNILLFTGTSEQKSNLSHIKKLREWLSEFHPDLIKTYVVSKEKTYDGDDIIYDIDEVIHKCYQITLPTIVIIRPDNYIAYYSENLEYIYLENYFKKIIIEAS